MGGVDKGLQMFRGQPLAQTALQRLRAQSGGAPGQIAFSANRNTERYAAMGVPVWTDSVPDFAGPLAGFLAALEHSQGRYDYVLTVPCDSPRFPLDLLARLSQALLTEQADIAMPMAAERQSDGSLRWFPQPVFCLMHASLLASLRDFVAQGGRKIGAWTATHAQTKLAFDGPTDDPLAFANTNTLDELHALEQT